VAVAERPPGSQPVARCAALTILATVRLRLGQPGATELLAEAQRLAEQMAELQRIGPVAAARCEQAALRGDSAAVIDIAEPVLAEAVQLGDQNLEAELAYQLRRAGRTCHGARWLVPVKILLASPIGSSRCSACSLVA
jgi:hypothetical protein